jgi:hypothetical protein
MFISSVPAQSADALSYRRGINILPRRRMRRSVVDAARAPYRGKSRRQKTAKRSFPAAKKQMLEN